jgi:hypothetical protein
LWLVVGYFPVAQFSGMKSMAAPPMVKTSEQKEFCREIKLLLKRQGKLQNLKIKIHSSNS